MDRMVGGLWRRLVSCFLAGVFAVLPLAITVAIIMWAAGFLKGIVGPDSLVGRGLRAMGMRFLANADTTLAYLLGCVLVLSLLLIIGCLAQMGGRRLWQGLMDRALFRLPVVGSIYNTASQLVGMLDKTEKTDLKRMSVVFCAFGQHAGGGVLALLSSPRKYHLNGRDYFMVYVPTSPVPMTGGLLLAPCEAVRRVEVSVEELMSVYLSMGVTGPQRLGEAP